MQHVGYQLCHTTQQASVLAGRGSGAMRLWCMRCKDAGNHDGFAQKAVVMEAVVMTKKMGVED